MPELQPPRASIALAAYAEPIVVAGRVLVVGEATTPLVERLLERGARLVHVVDADPGRVAEAATRNADRHVSFAPLGPGGLPVRDGAFDVAIVEDLASLPDPAHVLRQVRRALGARGTALVASRNPDATVHLLPLSEAGSAPDYYALYDLVTGVFDQVRMLGQAPFVGYSVFDFAPEAELEPALDAGFVPGGAEEPEWFIALAARDQTPLESLMIVQLTAREALGAGGTAQLERQLRAARAAERQARERLADAEAALARRGAEGLAREQGERIARLEAELQRATAWAQQLEGRAATADARADAVQAELDAAEERAAAVARELAAVTEELAAERRRHATAPGAHSADGGELARVKVELTALRAHAADLETRLQASSALEARLIELQAQVEEQTAARAEEGRRLAELAAIEAQAARDVASLEEQLAERGREIQALERAAREAARAGAELVAELARLREGQEIDALRATVTDLGRRNAELVAQLQAAEWALAAQRAAPAAGASALAPDAAREELGTALLAAEARVREQAVLLEQLRAQATSPQAAGDAQDSSQER